MDFFIKGQLSIESAEKLNLFMETQASIQDVPLKTGELRRLVFEGESRDLFVFEARTELIGECLELFTAFRDLMEEQNITGWMAWHECRHEEGQGTCSWNETFSWPPGGEN